MKFGIRKISIGSDLTFFHLVLSTPPDKKKVENTSTLYHPACGSQEQKTDPVRSHAYFPECKSVFNPNPKAGFPLGDFFRANKQKANVIAW